MNDPEVIGSSYDAVGRLTGSQHGDQAHRYAVSAAGNRLDGEQALSDNRLSQLNGTRYRYDGAGNMIERQQPDGERLTMGYDSTTVWYSSPTPAPTAIPPEAAYRYDRLGHQMHRRAPHDGTLANTHYGWDGDRIVQESDSQRSTIVYGEAACPCCVLTIANRAKCLVLSSRMRWVRPCNWWRLIANQMAGAA